MGEKKRRRAAGGKPKFNADAMLDAQLAVCREDCAKLEQAIAANPDHHEALYRLSGLRHRMSVVHRERGDEVALIAGNLNRAGCGESPTRLPLCFLHRLLRRGVGQLYMR